MPVWKTRVNATRTTVGPLDPRKFFQRLLAGFLLDHAALVGLPIALMTLDAQVATKRSRRAALRADR